MKPKTNKIINRIIMALFTFALCFSIMTPTVYAASYGNVGYYCNKGHGKTGKLVIGDSRCCQLWNYDTNGASFNATWGGHYGYGTETQRIDYTTKRDTMKTRVKACFEKAGSCDVYIFATVNDYNGVGDYKTAANNVISLAKTVWSYTAKVNGKTVHPTIHVMSLIGSKGTDVSAYNNYLKQQCNDAYRISEYINIKSCLSGSNGGYLSDNVHYNNATLKKIWNKID